MNEFKKDYASETKHSLLERARELMWEIEFNEMKYINVEIDDKHPESTDIRISIELKKDK